MDGKECQVSSPVIESPLMQLANASASAIRANLPNEENKDTESTNLLMLPGKNENTSAPGNVLIRAISSDLNQPSNLSVSTTRREDVSLRNTSHYKNDEDLSFMHFSDKKSTKNVETFSHSDKKSKLLSNPTKTPSHNMCLESCDTNAATDLPCSNLSSVDKNNSKDISCDTMSLSSSAQIPTSFDEKTLPPAVTESPSSIDHCTADKEDTALFSPTKQHSSEKQISSTKDLLHKKSTKNLPVTTNDDQDICTNHFTSVECAQYTNPIETSSPKEAATTSNGAGLKKSFLSKIPSHGGQNICSQTLKHDGEKFAVHSLLGCFPEKQKMNRDILNNDILIADMNPKKSSQEKMADNYLTMKGHSGESSSLSIESSVVSSSTIERGSTDIGSVGSSLLKLYSPNTCKKENISKHVPDKISILNEKDSIALSIGTPSVVTSTSVVTNTRKRFLVESCDGNVNKCKSSLNEKVFLPPNTDNSTNQPDKPSLIKSGSPENSSIDTISKQSDGDIYVDNKERSLSSDPSLVKVCSTVDDKGTCSPNYSIPKDEALSVQTRENIHPTTKNIFSSSEEVMPFKEEDTFRSKRPRRNIKSRHMFSSLSYEMSSLKQSNSSQGKSTSSVAKKQSQFQKKVKQTPEKGKPQSSCPAKKSGTTKTEEKNTMCSTLKKALRTEIAPCSTINQSSQIVSPTICPVANSRKVTTNSPRNDISGTFCINNSTTGNSDSTETIKLPISSKCQQTSTSLLSSIKEKNTFNRCLTRNQSSVLYSSTKSEDSICTNTDEGTANNSVKKQSFTKLNRNGDKIVPSEAVYLSSICQAVCSSSVNSMDNPIDPVQSETGSSPALLTRSVTVSSTLEVSFCSEDLSLKIAEAEKYIKKEPIDINQDISQKIKDDDSDSIANMCGPIGETQEIRKLLNASCNTQQIAGTNLSDPSTSIAQTRSIAPVQINSVSPYAIFLPVSLASGSTVTSTNTTTTQNHLMPSNNFQLSVPTVVRRDKPLLPNDNFITKKSEGIVQLVTNSKQDFSVTKARLISRNNPIATYYPTPLPESLMNKITISYHSCSECGDTFLFKSSLHTHKTRKCMQITYNCDNCTMKLVFYNKCSVLEHIRSHYPTRPVTIKMEKMDIVPLPESMTDLLETEVDSKEIAAQRTPEETNNFDCVECGAKFHNARALADHFGHSETICSYTYYCALCQSYLPRLCARHAHRRIHHEKAPHVCPECGQLIPNLVSFRHHLKYKCVHFSRIAPLTCPKCMSKFCYSPELKEHIITVHSETFIKCSICPMAFKAKSSYQTHHQNTHSSEHEQKKEIYKCPLCDTVFHSIQQLMNHVDVHINELKVGVNYAFRCSICSAIFDKRSLLLTHLGSCHHLDFVQHRCEFCDCVCKTAYNLQTHQKAIHKIEMKKVETLVKSKGKNELSKSKKNKDKGITHCPLCQIFFATQGQLQMHSMKVHQKKINDTSTIATKNKNSQKFCRYCRAPYKSWSRLMQHILGHRNSGVYICLICTNAAFHTKEELCKHEEFCSGENVQEQVQTVHECKDCHQLFKQENWLIAHQRNVHPKKAMFPCHLCGLLYKSNDSLHRHIQTVHEGKKYLYSCHICKGMNKEKTFRRQSQLDKHVMTKHKIPRNQINNSKLQFSLNDDNEYSKQSEDVDTMDPASCSSPDDQPLKKLKTAEEDIYSCAKCNFTSKSCISFQAHIQEHKTTSDGIQCSECGLCFAAVDSLRMHLFMVHKIKRTNEFLHNQGLIQTNESKPIIEKVPIKMAEISPKPLTNLEITPTEQTQSYECNVCYKSFENEHLLKVHMRTHGMAFIRSKRLNMSDST